MYAFLPVDWEEYFYVMPNVLSCILISFYFLVLDINLDFHYLMLLFLLHLVFLHQIFFGIFYRYNSLSILLLLLLILILFRIFSHNDTFHILRFPKILPLVHYLYNNKLLTYFASYCSL